MAMWDDLASCFRRIAGESAVRVVVIQGEDGAFASGADITEFPQHRVTRQQAEHYHDQRIAGALRAVLHCPVPVIAAIDGPCIGEGLEIAAACDLRLATTRSTVGVPTGRLGFPVAPAEASLLLGVYGRALVSELLLEGRVLSAAEAYQKSMVTRCVAPEVFDQSLQEMLQRVLATGPHASRRNKWLLNVLSPVEGGQALTAEQRDRCWDFVDTQDYARGIDGFLNKIPAQFQDN